MTANRWIAASLTAVTAVLSVCLYAVVAAPAVSEDVGIGPPPELAPGQAPPLPKSGPLAQPRSQDQVGFPSALTASVIPPTSPLTPATVALGEKLFFDSRLSGDGTVACATCHDPARAFTDGRPTSVGIHGRISQRNAPTVLNARMPMSYPSATACVKCCPLMPTFSPSASVAGITALPGCAPPPV